jgi:hypothetical protein
VLAVVGLGQETRIIRFIVQYLHSTLIETTRRTDTCIIILEVVNQRIVQHITPSLAKSEVAILKIPTFGQPPTG